MADNQTNLSWQNPIELELGKIVPAAFVGAITILGYSYVHTLFRAAGLSPLMLEDSVFDMVFRGVVLMGEWNALRYTLLVVAFFSVLLIFGAKSPMLIVRAFFFIVAFAVLFWGAVSVGRQQAFRQLSEYSTKLRGPVAQCDFVLLEDEALTADAAAMLTGLSDRGELRLLTRTSSSVFFMRNKVDETGDNEAIRHAGIQAFVVPSNNVGYCRFDSSVDRTSGRTS